MRTKKCKGCGRAYIPQSKLERRCSRWDTCGPKCYLEFFVPLALSIIFPEDEKEYPPDSVQTAIACTEALTGAYSIIRV